MSTSSDTPPEDDTNGKEHLNNNVNGNLNSDVRRHRLATDSKLRAYEAKRRLAYESKLQSSSLYWHAFRTLMHDSLLETQKANLLMRGWTNASKNYGESLMSVGEWCIDEKGTPVTEAKKKKKIFEVQEKSHVSSTGDSAQSMFPNQSRITLTSTDFYREENCGSIIQSLAGSAVDVAEKYEGMVEYMTSEVIPALSSLLDHLKSEVALMEKLGNSIMNDLETAEYEVCTAWDTYHNRTLEFCGSTSDANRLRGASNGATFDFNISVKGCADVWVEEMRYRMAVAFLSSVWEKCSSELSKLFLSMKDEECIRRNQIKELIIKACQQQERLWLGLPSIVDPIIKELIDWPMERDLVEEDIQLSIRERAQAIQRDEEKNKKTCDNSKSNISGLTITEGDGSFELSSPLVSDLMCKAKVIEKRSPGMMTTWKLCLAVITSDSFLQLFELPSTCKLHSGSAPEVAFQNLIPPVVVPTMVGVRAGIKTPSSKYWFENLVPSESFALPNCVVSMKDDENSFYFEIVETILTSGASKMFTKTVNRKMQFRAATREEVKDFVDALRRSK